MKKFNKNATINRWSYSSIGGHKLQFSGINDFAKYIAGVVMDTQQRHLRKEEVSYIKRKLFDKYPFLRNDHELYHPNTAFDIDPRWVDQLIEELAHLDFQYQLAVQVAIKDIYYPKPAAKKASAKKVPVNKHKYGYDET